ncbi:hypothetical protein SXANM310S_03877 [Streptomyces xanthochromogenes]
MATAQQVRGPGLHGARVELDGVEQQPRPGAVVLWAQGLGSAQRGLRVRDSGRRQQLGGGVRGVPLQVLQHEGRPDPGRYGRQLLLQGQFVRTADTGCQPQPPHGGQRGPHGPAPAGGTVLVGKGRAHHAAHDPAEGRRPVVARRGHPALLDRRRPGGQRVLYHAVRGEHAPMAAEPGRKDEVGQPDEPGVVLDERRLRLAERGHRTGRTGVTLALWG